MPHVLRTDIGSRCMIDLFFNLHRLAILRVVSCPKFYSLTSLSGSGSRCCCLLVQKITNLLVNVRKWLPCTCLMLTIKLNFRWRAHQFCPVWRYSHLAKIFNSCEIIIKYNMELRWDMPSPWIKNKGDIWCMWWWSTNVNTHTCSWIPFWNHASSQLKTLIKNVTGTPKCMEIWDLNFRGVETCNCFIWSSTICPMNKVI